MQHGAMQHGARPPVAIRSGARDDYRQAAFGGELVTLRGHQLTKEAIVNRCRSDDNDAQRAALAAAARNARSAGIAVKLPLVVS